MTILNILKYPDLRLRKKAKLINKFDSSIKKIIKNMKDTMYYFSGIGLAATQINVHKQIIILDISKTKKKLQIFINPKIIWLSNKKKNNQEGCLSLPGIYKNIKRSSKIKLQAYNINGKMFKIKVYGILSMCIQHEIDHLNGKIFIDYKIL